MNFSISEIMSRLPVLMEANLPVPATPDKVGYSLKQTADQLAASGNIEASNAVNAGIGQAPSAPSTSTQNTGSTGSIFGDLFDKGSEQTPMDVKPDEETQSRIMPAVNVQNHLPIDKLSPKTRQVIETGALVIVRESSDDKRSIGTMWFNKVPIGYTVEDPVRQSKIRDLTAVPAYVYNIGLRTTARTQLNRCAITLNGQLVLPAIGTDSGCVNIKVGNISFAGCRIHDGVDETWSSGCIIYSDKEVSPGKLVQNPKAVQDLSRVISSNHIDKITIINEFEARNAI